MYKEEKSVKNPLKIDNNYKIPTALDYSAKVLDEHEALYLIQEEENAKAIENAEASLLCAEILNVGIKRAIASRNYIVDTKFGNYIYRFCVAIKLKNSTGLNKDVLNNLIKILQTKGARDIQGTINESESEGRFFQFEFYYVGNQAD